MVLTPLQCEFSQTFKGYTKDIFSYFFDWKKMSAFIRNEFSKCLYSDLRIIFSTFDFVLYNSVSFIITRISIFLNRPFEDSVV